MKQVIKFQVSVKIANDRWQLSEEFDTYDKAQTWRLEKERELFKANPNRRGIVSNMLFNRHTVEGK